VQTALLGAAIAIILALVTALVGPLFVDWGRFRDAFEAKAQHLTGLEVKIAGPIEVHLLPTPTVKLQEIEAKRAGDVVRARSVQIEFALDALMRGEFRAANIAVTGPEVALGLDRNGRFEWSAAGSDAEALSMDRVSVEDGRVTLSDARSGGTLTLEKLTFHGELRSLAGPAKGDGAFVVAGEPYAYRLSTNRPAADGAVRVHLTVDTADQPRLADIDGSVWSERGVPHFDANLQWAHGFGRARAGEPFRVTGHVRGTSATVAVDKVELQYGPEDRAARLHGDATLTLGQKPELAAMLAATQIDLDRLGMLPEAVRRKPLAVIHSLGERWSSLQQFPLPVRLGIGVDAVTLAGASLQRLSADFHGGAGAWTLDNLAFRAPGVTQMRLGGRLNVTPTGADFAGPVHIEARDPRALVSWLTDRSDALATTGAFRADGEVRVGPESFAIDHLKAELDRVSLEGRFAYRWPATDRPARIEAALSAPEVDFDKAYGLAQDMLAGTLGGVPFEWPREGTLALNVAHSSVAGVAVQGTDVDLRFDDRTLDIERLAVADLGGASIAAKGKIDLSAQSPQGNVTLDLDVRTADGVIAVLDKLAPDAARDLRRSAGRYLPAKLTGSLATDASPAAGSAPASRFKIGGSAGQFAFSLEGGATTDALAFTDLAKLGAAKLDLTGSLSAADGGMLVQLVGLDRLVVADKGAGRLDFKARGALDDPMTVDGRITAGALDMAANGTLRLPLGRAAIASLALAVAKADLRTPGGTVPAALNARVELTDTAVALTGISGQVAGAEVTGRLTAGLARPTRLDGDLSLSRADLPALIAAAAGMPAALSNGTANSAEPFGSGLFAGAAGKILVVAADAALTPQLSAHDLHGTLSITPAKVVLEDVAGALAGGTLSGRLDLENGAAGLVADGRIALRDADMAVLLPGEGTLSGRLSLEAMIDGSGRSPVALMGSLRGSGTFTAQDASIAHLNPAAFATVIGSIDAGTPIEPAALKQRLDAAVAAGTFGIPRLLGTLTVAGGVARLAATMPNQGSDLAVAADVDLAARLIDATLTLTGPAGLGPPEAGRPMTEIALRGPVDSPVRSLDTTALADWLSLRAIAVNAQRLQDAQATQASDQARADQSKADLAKVEQARADQAKADLAKAEQARAEQAKAEQARRAEQARADQAKAEEARRAEEARVAQAKAEQARAEQAKAEEARRAEEARVAQAKAEEARRAELARAEQARAEQAKAEETRRAELARAEQARAEQAKAEEARRAEQARAEQARAEQAKAEQARRAEEARLEQVKAEQAKAEQARRAEEARAAQARAEQAKAEQARRAEEARLAQAKAEQAKAEQARRAEEARAEQARAEQARAEQARSDALAMIDRVPPDAGGRAGQPIAPPLANADPAMTALDQAIAANPNDATSISRRGQMHVLKGDFSLAIRDFDEVLRQRPRDPEALNNRCWARAILGELQVALRDCNEALAIRPSYADALDSRGFVNLKIGQPGSAIADYDAALKLNPRQASSLYGRGLAKVKTGKAADGQRDIAAAKALQGNIADEFSNLGVR
jgi:uncharacterized protein involved in outer membrane biogenesis/tetratricopeptide (TPR) repeat protein